MRPSLLLPSETGGICRTAFVETPPPRFAPELGKRGAPVGSKRRFDKRLGRGSRRPRSLELRQALRRDMPQ
eukprot:4690936-Pyramimonas_sp.AAC.1